MVYGNLAERFELSSMKSAGISLIRIMWPGILLALFTFGFSLLASNYLKPQANYNFQSRLKAIRKQKATLVLEEKIFERDFDDFIIRIDQKMPDGRGIKDVTIYDHSGIDKSLLNLTKAQSGEMYTDTSSGNFIMELSDGHQYTELKREYRKEKGRTYPLMRTSFKKYRKEFDLSAFNTDDSSSGINRRKEDMLTAYQLTTGLDSLRKDMSQVYTGLDSTLYVWKERPTIAKLGTLDRRQTTPPQKLPIRSISDSTVVSIAQLINGSSLGKEIIRAAKQKSMSNRELLRSTKNTLHAFKHKEKKYVLRLHQQFSFATICLVFLFLGAPLGNIIRKGGYGYPLLYAILFYMLFIMMAIMGEKLIRNDDLHPIIAAWLPNIIVAPLAIWLTFRALRDKKSLFWG